MIFLHKNIDWSKGNESFQMSIPKTSSIDLYSVITWEGCFIVALWTQMIFTNHCITCEITFSVADCYVMWIMKCACSWTCEIYTRIIKAWNNNVICENKLQDLSTIADLQFFHLLGRLAQLSGCNLMKIKKHLTWCIIYPM